VGRLPTQVYLYKGCKMVNTNVTFLRVSNVPLTDITRFITSACTLVTMEVEFAWDLSLRPDGVLPFARLGVGVARNRRQDTPITVFVFAIKIIEFYNLRLYILSTENPSPIQL